MRKLACFWLFFAAPLFAGCGSQTFDVGGFSNDGGSADGGADGSTTAQAIDPIALGYQWTYNVNVAGTYAACQTGGFTASVTDHQTIDGKDAFYVSSFCPGVGSFWYSADGDTVYEYDGTNWLLAIDAPVEDGHTWTNGAETFIWKKIGSMPVGGVTFPDCWEIDDQAAPTYYAVTFCRGVGPVKWHVRDATGTPGTNGYDATLTAKNFL